MLFHRIPNPVHNSVFVAGSHRVNPLWSKDGPNNSFPADSTLFRKTIIQRIWRLFFRKINDHTALQILNPMPPEYSIPSGRSNQNIPFRFRTPPATPEDAPLPNQSQRLSRCITLVMLRQIIPQLMEEVIKFECPKHAVPLSHYPATKSDPSHSESSRDRPRSSHSNFRISRDLL